MIFDFLSRQIRDAAGIIGDLSASIFWDIATSAPVLMAIAMVGVVAFVAAHLPTIAERLFPFLIPYFRAALLVQVLAFFALAFLLGFRVADDRAETEKLKNELAWSEFQLEEQKAAADSAHELKQKAEAEAADAKGKFDEYREKFGDKARACEPAPGYPEWLRSIQRRPQNRTAARQSHSIIARLRGSGEKRR
jgi:hypothetical protein